MAAENFDFNPDLKFFKELKNSFPEELYNILSEFDKALKKREEFELGFNIFSIISDSYYKENLHSEIIFALLNPDEKHKEGRKFLDLFLDVFEINRENYKEHISVSNEFSIKNQRRIDILIQSSTHAIIVENKVNGARDMDNQIPDYYKYCVNMGFEVDHILYLSIDGCKKPDEDTWVYDDPKIKAEIREKIKCISVYDIKTQHTIFQWLEKCKEKAENEDTRFIIKQYQQLLKSLRGYIMETSALETYYTWLSEKSNKDFSGKINTLSKMHNDLKYFYRDKLIKGVAYNPCNPKENAVTFDNIGNTQYFLKVTFKNNEECALLLDDAQNKWQLDFKLKKNKEFMDLFDEDFKWIYKKNQYNLIDNFNELIKDVKHILSLVSTIIDKK